jgi:hypothetical protein
MARHNFLALTLQGDGESGEGESIPHCPYIRVCPHLQHLRGVL